MVIFITSGLLVAFLILDKIEAFFDKKYVAKKDMSLSLICFLCAGILVGLLLPRLFHGEFSMLSFLIGGIIGLGFSLPFLWGILKKANKREFSLSSWTMDWTAFQVFTIGVLFLLLAVSGFILMVFSIEMGIEAVIPIVDIVLFVVICFFVSSFVEIKIIECLYKKEFILGWLGRRKTSLPQENSREVVEDQTDKLNK